MVSSKRLLLICSLLAAAARGHDARPTLAQEQPPREVQWRRTAGGWERADGWFVDARVSQAAGFADVSTSSPSSCLTVFHPAILAGLQLAVSWAALALFTQSSRGKSSASDAVQTSGSASAKQNRR
jgi:hypothetical protein